MKNTVQKYIRIYLKRNAILLLCICAPISILFFIVSLFADVLPYDIWLIFLPLLLGVLIFCISTLYVFRFKRLISVQENYLHTVFNDNHAHKIAGTITYLSDDWLIIAGSCAFHRQYIRSFSVKSVRGIHGTGHKVTVNTIDGKKCSFWSQASSDIKKMRAWRKNKTD